MNPRTCLITGVSAFLGACLSFATASPTNAQFGRAGEATDDVPNDLLPKVKGLERTDLFGSQPHLEPRTQDSRGARHRDVARLAYQKLQYARERNHGAISDEVLSGASLEWFKAEVSVAKSKGEAVRAASEYLNREREGVKP